MDETNTDVLPAVVTTKSEPKRFFAPKKGNVANLVPVDISENKFLATQIEKLPGNYNFEIPKTIWRIKEMDVKTVALQMPEGLTMFGCTIADIIEEMTGSDVIVMGDVTYGACCIDDFTARALGVDLLVHYGHSCLVPVNETPGIKVLYVFVDIQVDLVHFLDSVLYNFTKGSKLALVSTIQFVSAVQSASRELSSLGYTAFNPQARPLSPGEILGCTSPTLPNDTDGIIYLGDGRFHIESIMIANPTIKAFKYDPYSKKLTSENYDFNLMCSIRAKAINTAKRADTFGLILGTLGRQGSTAVVTRLRDLLASYGKSCIAVFMSEIIDSKLAQFENVDCWVQVACPRLSIDWGSFFNKPLLTPAELHMVLKSQDKLETLESYPMDYYARNSAGPWTPNNLELKELKNEISKIEKSLLSKCSNSTCDCT